MHLQLQSLSGRDLRGQARPPLRQTALMSDSDQPQGSDHEKALAEPVFCGDRYRRFGELGPAEARRLSSDLKAAGSWGPMSKVGSVALAWRELAERLEEDGTATVAELKPDEAIQFARRLWVLPPPGGML